MLVARAELLDEAAESEASVAAVYGEAMAAYGRACMLSSSEDGDDLPGLLNNWGVGLHSLGTHAKVALRPSQLFTQHVGCPQLHLHTAMRLRCHESEGMHSSGAASHTPDALGVSWANTHLQTAHQPLPATAHNVRCICVAMAGAMRIAIQASSSGMLSCSAEEGHSNT